MDGSAIEATLENQPASSATEPSEQGLVRVALYRVEGEPSPRRARLLREGLLRELHKLDGIEASDALGRSSSATEEISCPQKQRTCLARLAAALGADEVVKAAVATIGDSRVLTLQRVRLADAEVVQAATRRLKDDGGEGLMLVLGATVAELFPDHGLKGGTKRGVELALASRWSPPPIRPWLFWSGVVATGAAAATAVVFSVSAKQAQDDYNAYARGGNSRTAISGHDLVAKGQVAKRRATITNVAWIGTAALAVGTAVLGLFTDWGKDPDWTVVPGDGGTVGLGTTWGGR